MIKKVKINGFDWKIIYAKAKVADRFGETNLSSKEITIFSTDNEQIIKETLQHEILHVLLEDIIPIIVKISDDEVAEETLIRLVSPRLFTCMKENPKLSEYLWN